MKQPRIRITPIQRRVLANLAADPPVIPRTTEEFEAYVNLRDMGLADYDPATLTVTPTWIGYEVLRDVQP